MKSRLFPPDRVALVVNRLAIHSSCALPDEKSIDFIWYVMDWDWYYNEFAAMQHEN
jgi:hypothetical protein